MSLQLIFPVLFVFMYPVRLERVAAMKTHISHTQECEGQIGSKTSSKKYGSLCCHGLTESWSSYIGPNRFSGSCKINLVPDYWSSGKLLNDL